MPLRVHYTPGDGKGWALDEDLRQIRASLKGLVVETSAAGAQIIHAPFWQNLSMVDPAILQGAFVIAHADNPPFFYVKQPEFAIGQTWVDLWVARSTEALEQFRSLGLPAVHIPYTIDPDLFFPVEDKKAIRREFGIPENAYVIANFHRDTEGADLKTPKFQKAPEMMVAILKRVRDAGAPFHVLLAGPRRHWIREELEKEGIPFTFVGKPGIAGDDFGVNILSRAKLNRLYNAADLHLVPSRWEGGPQSAMEAAACRIKQLCPPIGVARDILEKESIFHSAAEAAGKIIDDIQSGTLNATIEPQFDRWKSSHTTESLAAGLRALYDDLPRNESFQAKASLASGGRIQREIGQLGFTLRRRTRRPSLPPRVRWNHLPGRNSDLDEIMRGVRDIIEKLKITVTNSNDAAVEIAGWPIQDIKKPRRIFQWVAPEFPTSEILAGATLVAPSVQDVLNLRWADILHPAVVLPVLPSGEGKSDCPLVVEPGDRFASVRVWRALQNGRPVIHPQDMAYAEQVFWGGLIHGDDLHCAPAPNAQELSSLLRVPEPGAITNNLKKLLAF